MSTQGQQLRTLFTDPYNTGPNTYLGLMLDGTGSVLDTLDPAQSGLVNQWSASTATGAALDANGAEWVLPRNAGESDASYRSRILAVLPAFSAGPTVGALSGAVASIVGTPPTISQRGDNDAVFPLTFSPTITFGPENTLDVFTIDLTVNNPNNVTYSQSAVIAAVRMIKRAIATVLIHWDTGGETSVQ